MSDGEDEHDRRAITVALVNDYELVLNGLAAMLSPFRPGLAVTELAVDTEPLGYVDVALFDAYGNPRLGLDRISALTRSSKIGAVALYTSHATPEQRDEVLELGARGVLSKAMPAQDLADALVAVADGTQVVSDDFRPHQREGWPGSELGLTARESEVAALLTQGMSNKDIARALWISENTVKSHLKSIFQKTEASSRSQAIARVTGHASFFRRRSA
jgi:DNA-binding NarL/FixJ family response regulator